MALGSSSWAGSTELSGEVIRWEKDLGALHLRAEDGEEVVVPVLDHTEIVADYADYSSGKLFEAGERVQVSREDNGPLRVEVRPVSEEDEPVAAKIRDEMEPLPEQIVDPQAAPTPSASPLESPKASSAEVEPDEVVVEGGAGGAESEDGPVATADEMEDVSADRTAVPEPEEN